MSGHSRNQCDWARTNFSCATTVRSDATLQNDSYNYASVLRRAQQQLAQSPILGDGSNWLLDRLLSEQDRQSHPFEAVHLNGVVACYRVCRCDDSSKRPEIWVAGPTVGDPKIAFLGIPKAAWTQLLLLAARAAASFGGSAAQDACCFSREEQKRLFAGTRRIPRATMVRFPPARYISAFMDKYPGKGAKDADGFRKFILAYVVSLSPDPRLLDGPDWKSVPEHDRVGWAGHWSPQGLPQGLHLVQYDHVWRMEDMPWAAEEHTLGAAGIPAAGIATHVPFVPVGRSAAERLRFDSLLQQHGAEVLGKTTTSPLQNR